MPYIRIMLVVPPRDASGKVVAEAPKQPHISPLFHSGDMMVCNSTQPLHSMQSHMRAQTLWVYLSPDENYTAFSASDLVWQQSGLLFGDWGLSNEGDELLHTLNVSLPEVRLL